MKTPNAVVRTIAAAIVMLTSVLSAGNSGMYASTRMLYTLACQRMAPRIFARVSANGVPVKARREESGDHVTSSRRMPTSRSASEAHARSTRVARSIVQSCPRW